MLLIASNGEGRTELGEALGRHADVGGMVAGTLSMGLCLAERYRPELVFIDLGVANVQAFDACHVLSSLSTRAQRRCRVIAGTATVTDAVEKPALMAGAANVTLFPFTLGLFESELGRLEERLGPRKTPPARLTPAPPPAELIGSPSYGGRVAVPASCRVGAVFVAYLVVSPYFERLNNPNENVRVWATRAIVSTTSCTSTRSSANGATSTTRPRTSNTSIRARRRA